MSKGPGRDRDQKPIENARSILAFEAAYEGLKWYGNHPGRSGFPRPGSVAIAPKRPYRADGE